MKRIIIFTALFLSLNSVVFSQEKPVNLINIPQKRDEIKQQIEAKKLNLSLEIKQKRDEIKQQNEISILENNSKIQIIYQEKVLKIITNVFELFEAVLVKFDGIITRIDLRISKLKDQGLDTSESEKLLIVAKENIKKSTVLILASNIELQEAIKNGLSKDKIKEIVDSCKESLKETKSSLIDVVVSLKKSGDEDDEYISFE